MSGIFSSSVYYDIFADHADVLVHARLVASMPDEELLMFLDSLLMVDDFYFNLDALLGIMVLDVNGVTEVICPAGQNISSQGQCASKYQTTPYFWHFHN